MVLFIFEVNVGNGMCAHLSIAVLLGSWMQCYIQELLAVCWIQQPKGLYLGFLIAIHMPESSCKIFRLHIPLVGLLSCSANMVHHKWNMFLVWTEAGCKYLQKLPSLHSRGHVLQHNQGKGVWTGNWVVQNARIVTVHVWPYLLTDNCCSCLPSVFRWP